MVVTRTLAELLDVVYFVQDTDMVSAASLLAAPTSLGMIGRMMAKGSGKGTVAPEDGASVPLQGFDFGLPYDTLKTTSFIRDIELLQGGFALAVYMQQLFSRFLPAHLKDSNKRVDLDPNVADELDGTPGARSGSIAGGSGAGTTPLKVVPKVGGENSSAGRSSRGRRGDTASSYSSRVAASQQMVNTCMVMVQLQRVQYLPDGAARVCDDAELHLKASDAAQLYVGAIALIETLAGRFNGTISLETMARTPLVMVSFQGPAVRLGARFAVEVQQAVAAKFAKGTPVGKLGVGVSVGVSIGRALRCNVGTKTSMHQVVLGRPVMYARLAVALAARLGGALVLHPTAHPGSAGFAWQGVDVAHVPVLAELRDFAAPWTALVPRGVVDGISEDANTLTARITAALERCSGMQLHGRVDPIGLSEAVHEGAVVSADDAALLTVGALVGLLSSLPAPAGGKLPLRSLCDVSAFVRGILSAGFLPENFAAGVLAVAQGARVPKHYVVPSWDKDMSARVVQIYPVVKEESDAEKLARVKAAKAAKAK